MSAKGLSESDAPVYEGHKQADMLQPCRVSNVGNKYWLF